MNIPELTASTLALFGGGESATEINAAIKTAAADTYERGHDGKKRKVTITLEFEQSEKKPEVIITTLQTKTTLPGGKKIEDLTTTNGEGSLFFKMESEEGEEEGPRAMKEAA
mgnify:CR=1 FL=1